ESPLLFTDNETNEERIFGQPNRSRFVKDAFHDTIVHGRAGKVNPDCVGTKAAAHAEATIAPGQSAVWQLRLTPVGPEQMGDPFDGFAEAFTARQQEADEFYRGLIPQSASEDQARVMRQALAGMLWSKQYYYLDASRWLAEHGIDPFEERNEK